MLCLKFVKVLCLSCFRRFKGLVRRLLKLNDKIEELKLDLIDALMLLLIVSYSKLAPLVKLSIIFENRKHVKRVCLGRNNGFATKPSQHASVAGWKIQ